MKSLLNFEIQTNLTHLYVLFCIILQVKNMVHKREVVIVGGSDLLHFQKKLAIAISIAMCGHFQQETEKDGHFHVRSKMYIDSAILKEVPNLRLH